MLLFLAHSDIVYCYVVLQPMSAVN